jgi:hypothetical protein
MKAPWLYTPLLAPLVLPPGQKELTRFPGECSPPDTCDILASGIVLLPVHACMASHRPGPYDRQLPSLAEVERALALWTPGNWEVWEELTTRAGRRVFQVAAAGKPILSTIKTADANLAAKLLCCTETVLSLLEFL